MLLKTIQTFKQYASELRLYDPQQVQSSGGRESFLCVHVSVWLDLQVSVDSWQTAEKHFKYNSGGIFLLTSKNKYNPKAKTNVKCYTEPKLDIIPSCNHPHLAKIDGDCNINLPICRLYFPTNIKKCLDADIKPFCNGKYILYTYYF